MFQSYYPFLRTGSLVLSMYLFLKTGQLFHDEVDVLSAGAFVQVGVRRGIIEFDDFSAEIAAEGTILYNDIQAIDLTAGL